jgi:hypothetical protein
MYLSCIHLRKYMRTQICHMKQQPTDAADVANVLDMADAVKGAQGYRKAS